MAEFKSISVESEAFDKFEAAKRLEVMAQKGKQVTNTEFILLLLHLYEKKGVKE